MAYLVTDMDAAVRAAKKAGAAILVAPFPDAIGRDAIVQWPGGVNAAAPIGTPPLNLLLNFQTVPESRLCCDRAGDKVTTELRRFRPGKDCL